MFSIYEYILDACTVLFAQGPLGEEKKVHFHTYFYLV